MIKKRNLRNDSNNTIISMLKLRHGSHIHTAVLYQHSYTLIHNYFPVFRFMRLKAHQYLFFCRLLDCQLRW